MNTELRHIGQYIVQKRLGNGKGAGVWKTFDTRSQCYVAIKFFRFHPQADVDFMKRLSSYAEAIASLHHPNIVRIRDFQVIPSQQSGSTLAYIVMNYVEGPSLADYIQSTLHLGKIPPGADIIHLFASISLAIDYAHQHGIIHGNLKPTNILLNRNNASSGHIGEPVLTDFGLANLLGTSPGTLIRRSLDTVRYISPEQAQGQIGSERSDLYSLGVILYELCTGVLPFHGNRPVSLIKQHIYAAPPPPAQINPNISPALSQAILRSLAKNPAERYTSARSMIIALTQTLAVQVPKSLSQFAYLPNDLNESNHHIPLPPDITQSPGSSSQTSMFRNNRPEISAAPMSAGGLAVTSPPAPASLRSQRRGWFGQWHLIVFIALVVASLGTLGALFLPPRPGAVATNQVVGHAYFVNSGQLNADSPQGLNDELQIDLSHVLAPSPGKSYYAWLLADRNQSEAAPILLGRLAINHEAVHFLYQGNQQHANLLASISRFLITEDNAHNPTSNPLIDTSTWRYYAEIPQLPNPGDKLHFSMLDHLRHLLVESPELKLRGLHGGLAFWFDRNTETISALANNARDAWHNQDSKSIYDQIIRILDYLDGESFVHSDVPQGTPLLGDPLAAQVALLGPAPQNPDPAGYTYSDEASPGYVYLISIHMVGAIQSPQTTAGQRKLAMQINAGIDSVKRLLEQVHQDAKQLLRMSKAQLLQNSSLSILNDLATQAQYAYTGQFDPSTGQPNGGALWIYSNLQRLATFDVRPF